MMRVNKTLGIDIRADFVVRMRSLGKSRQEIEQLSLFLEASIDNVNDIAIINRR
jgi:hypothetical protein